MARVVVDTNVVVSGLLWQGPSRRVLDAARTGEIQLFTSAVMLSELADVLSRPKLAHRLALVGTDVDGLVMDFASLATVIQPADVGAVVLEDPDDDAVLACAVAARAEYIVSGDKDLHRLGGFRGIPVLTAVELLERLAA